MSSLSINGVTKSYGSLQVLHNVDLAIDGGDFLVLVGPSGCGKSTLLNIVAGLDPHTDGAILIGDTDVGRLEPKDRDIAMVFQSYALYPSMTVERNIGFSLEMAKVDKTARKARVAEVAQLLKIEHLLDRRPSQLSGGQRQRVAIGRALVRKPKLFLFDEPLSNLDAKLRVEMRGEIKKLHQRLRTTMVYVTHDQIEAMTLATHIAVMRDGEVQQFGSPSEIYARPANTFVATFMGSPPMNLVRVRYEATQKVLVAEALPDFPIPLPSLYRAQLFEDGQPLLLGIRPEHISLGARTSASETYCWSFDHEVALTEPTGPSTLVSLDFNGIEVIAAAGPDIDVTIGSKQSFSADMSKSLLFDDDTGSQIAFAE